MWFLRTVVVALVTLMIIGASESKPQNNVDQNAINDLTPDQLINLLQGIGNIAVPTSPPLPKPINDLTHDQLINLLQGTGNIAVPTSPPAVPTSPPLPKQSNGQCTCVPLQSCCDPGPDPGPGPGDSGGSINGAPILTGIVNPRNHIIDVNDRQNIVCNDVLTVCCNTICSTPKPPGFRPPTSNECGIRNLNGIDVTIEGFQDRQAQLGEFPWMVAVLDQSTNYVGGGSLVHPKIVLTAAHKVHGKSGTSLVARIGDWDLGTTNEPISNQNINVERVLFHPGWDRDTLVNDVALLILQNEATLGPTVSPICMPSKTDNFDGSNCIVTGWGKDVFGAAGLFQKIMKEVTVPAVSHSECQRLLRNTRLGSQFFLHNTFNCAGANGEDACDGDGGSPLICPDPSNPNRYVQMGVVAWGIGCGKVGNPGVYGSIPATVEWINENIRNEGSIGFDIRTGQ